MHRDRISPHVVGGHLRVHRAPVARSRERRWAHWPPSRSTPDEIVVVIDHNADLSGRAAAGADRRAGGRQSAGAGDCAEPATPGSQATSGAVVAFMDDDAVADPDWLRRSSRTTATRGDRRWRGQSFRVGTAGARVAFPRSSIGSSAARYRGMPTRRKPVRNLIGANMSFRREVFRTSPEDSPMGSAGSAPHRRRLRRDRVVHPSRERRCPPACILYEPEARVSHRVPAARGSWRYFGTRCYREGLSKAQVTQRRGNRSRRSRCERAMPRERFRSGSSGACALRCREIAPD